MMQVTITGLKETVNFVAKLPSELNKEILNKSEEFMKFVQKSAKLRAPRATGFLASQITVKSSGNVITLDTGEAWYAYHQEFGYKPHKIPFQYIFQHISSPEAKGQYIENYKGAWVIPTKYTPFLFPALEAGLSRLPNMLSNAVKNAINKSR